MTDPKVILVDEPTAGLAKLLSEEVYQMLDHLRDREGLAILLADQEIREALKIDDVYVLEFGCNKFEGPSSSSSLSPSIPSRVELSTSSLSAGDKYLVTMSSLS